jgi:hypothetical protein
LVRAGLLACDLKVPVSSLRFGKLELQPGSPSHE